MINSEETIGKVLAGLRDTETPPGMERRILTAIEARASEHPVVAPRWVWSVALAGAVAVCLFMTIAVIYRHGQTPTQAQQHVLPAESVSGTQEALLLPQKPISPTRMTIRNTPPGRKLQSVSAADAVLLREMRAPSHPAPEAPLTHEEKLLLRAVHLGDPQLIAMLDPEERARQEAASEAEFRMFVEQSGNDDHKSNQTTE
jgi:hypothetical protein